MASIVASARSRFRAEGVRTCIAGWAEVPNVNVRTLLFSRIAVEDDPEVPAIESLLTVAATPLFATVTGSPFSRLRSAPLRTIHPMANIPSNRPFNPNRRRYSPPIHATVHRTGRKKGAKRFGCVHVKSCETVVRKEMKGDETTRRRSIGGGRVRRTSVGDALAPSEARAVAEVELG